MLSFQTMDNEIIHAELISAINRAVNAESAAEWIKRSVSFRDKSRSIAIGARKFSLGEGKLFISGFGKCAEAMAKGVSEIFGDAIEKGLLLSYDDKKLPHGISILASSHPLPNCRTIIASQKLVDFHLSMSESDTVLCLVSGGGSSFFEIPDGAVELSELIKTNGLLLSSGASVAEVNVVRKALSKVKGGKLLKLTKAPIITLAISDVIGGGPGDIASGPTWPHINSASEALDILKKYNILAPCPKNVVRHLRQKAGFESEKTAEVNTAASPKYFVIGDNSKMLKAFSLELSSLGYNMIISKRRLTGPVETEAGAFMKSLLKLAATARNKTCFIAGGEAPVKVTGNKEGGRCQHFVLLCAKAIGESGIENWRKISVAAFASDGADGFTDSAGAVLEAGTALKIGPEIISNYAASFASHDFFKKYGGLIRTGHTGHNVNDFFIGIIN
ncbi:MAG TPA: DUF4147 domain-containing protein [Candidatus Wallbacteria bacterium]|nr:DUF4147 domain-containing protein [Candidatus Wallbacteria bacterium]